MAVNLTDSQEKFVEECPTTWRMYWINFYKRLNDRPENRGSKPIDDVEARREYNRQLKAMQEDIAVVRQNTEDVPWLSKFVANLFKYAGGETEKRYPSRKK